MRELGLNAQVETAVKHSRGGRGYGEQSGQDNRRKVEIVPENAHLMSAFGVEVVKEVGLTGRGSVGGRPNHARGAAARTCNRGGVGMQKPRAAGTGRVQGGQAGRAPNEMADGRRGGRTANPVEQNPRAGICFWSSIVTWKGCSSRDCQQISLVKVLLRAQVCMVVVAMV